MTASQHAIDTAGELLRSRIGLRLEPSFRGRLVRAVGDAARLAGRDPDDFVNALAGDPESLQRLFDAVTVQESGFFRHPEHFDVLTRHLLPSIVGPVRIWSAACGNGQEAYSLAMVLAEGGVDGRVLATDISSAAVGRTGCGRYSDRELAGLSAWRQAVHGTHEGSSWTVRDAVRARLDVGVRNLLDPVPPEVASCQVVFCRNVLIYFTPEHATALLDRLADRLPANAHVFLGGAETMWHISERFESCRFDDTFVYRVRDAPARPATLAQKRSVARRVVPTAALVGRRQQRRAVSPSGESTTMPNPDSAGELARLGQAALAVGDPVTAVRMFRRWAYLDPDAALAHFHLGLALEAGHDPAAAARTFAVSRALLLRGGHSDAVDSFGGYGRDDVLRLLAAKRPPAP